MQLTSQIYLAGKCSELTVKQSDAWRIKFINELDLSIMNTTSKVKCINPNDYYSYEMTPIPNVKEVMTYLLRRVKGCNILVANVGDFSIGTIMEIQCAFDHQIPIILINEPETKIYNWLELQADKIFVGQNAIKDAATYLADYYL